MFDYIRFDELSALENEVRCGISTIKKKRGCNLAFIPAHCAPTPLPYIHIDKSQELTYLGLLRDTAKPRSSDLAISLRYFI